MSGILAGKQARFQVANTDFCLTTTLSLDRSVDSFDGTAFQSTNKVIVPTLPNFNGSMGAIFDNAANTTTSLDTILTAVEAGMSTPVSGRVVVRMAANVAASYTGGMYLSGSLSAELNGPVAGSLVFTAANNIVYAANTVVSW